jgi:hypothetical protein
MDAVPRPRAWLVLLAFVLALGAFAQHADAQAFRPRSRNGLPKRGPIAAVTATAAAPATPVAAAAKTPVPAARKAAVPARPVAAKKATTKKGKGGDDDDVVVVDDEDEDE